MEFPTGILGAALGTILLPSLAKCHASDQSDDYSRLLDWGLRLTILLAVPSAVGLAALSTPIIASFYHYGRFDWHDVMMTRQSLMAYTLGLLGLILVKVLAPGFYARQNVRTPVRIAIGTLCLTQVFNAVFMFVLPKVGPGWVLGPAGLALAIGIGASFNAALLYRQLRRHGIYTPQPGWARFVLKVLAAIAAMAVALIWADPSSQWWSNAPWTHRFPALGALVALGAGVYFLCLGLLGFRPRDFSRRAA